MGVSTVVIRRIASQPDYAADFAASNTYVIALRLHITIEVSDHSRVKDNIGSPLLVAATFDRGGAHALAAAASTVATAHAQHVWR